MRWNRTLFRLCAGVAIGALGAQATMAQPAPPPLPRPGDLSPATQDQPDPPERVGRIARIGGTASFHQQGDTQWSPAAVNFPVASGNAFWTEPAARMVLEIGASRVAMAGGTEFDIATLDPNGLQGVAARGEVWLHLRDLAPDEAWTVTTPRGLVRLNGPGRYAIAVGTTDDPTLVTVIDGSARVEGPDLSLEVEAGQTVVLTGLETYQGSIEPARRDPFIDEMLAAERPPAPPPQMPAAVASTVAGLPGGVAMMEAGTWAEAPDYGPVWYPPVEPGWVPYRHGHWAYVAPWGWTWIDDAPWGFAPFHYGRWVEYGGRWCWTPADIAVVRSHPVYAPALVAFIGLGAGVAVGAALASHSVGWVPLGPHEPFRPWYRASPRYVQQVNVTNVTSNVTLSTFINRGAATSVPATALIASRPVAPLARPVPPQQLAAARPIVGQQPVMPAAATAGVTPVTARTLGLGAVPRQAPGPAIRPQAQGGAPGPAIQPPGAGPGHPAGFSGPALRPPASAGQPPNGAAHAPPPGGRTVPPGPGMVTPQPGAAARPGANTAPPIPGLHPGLPQRPNLPSVTTPREATPGSIPQHASPLPSVTSPLPSAASPNPAGAPTQHFAEPRPAAPAQPQHGMIPQAAPGPMPQHGMPPVTTPQPMPNTAPAPMPHAAPAPMPHLAAPAAAQPHFAAPPAPAPHLAPAPAPAPHVSAPPPAPHPAERPRRPGEPS